MIFKKVYCWFISVRFIVLTTEMFFSLRRFQTNDKCFQIVWHFMICISKYHESYGSNANSIDMTSDCLIEKYFIDFLKNFRFRYEVSYSLVSLSLLEFINLWKKTCTKAAPITGSNIMIIRVFPQDFLRSTFLWVEFRILVHLLSHNYHIQH